MNIFNLHNSSSPKKGCYYIFDSNIWLPLLGLDSETLSSHYKNYFAKIFKTEDCSILLCPLQISEVLNRLLRFHAQKLYSKTNKGKPFSEYYKHEYRASKDFKIQYNNIIDDIDQYRSHLIIQDLKNIEFEYLTDFDTQKMDFNDHYLYLFAKENNATLITNDGDFFGLDVIVGTYNKKLYNKYKDMIKPK